MVGFIVKKTLDNKQLALYLSKQVNSFFPDENPVPSEQLLKYIDAAEERVFHCFSNIKKKYFSHNGNVHFNHLLTDQYCMYLYMLSNYIWKLDQNDQLSTKLYYLNKALHSVDIYFTTELPSIFLLVHPIGTILGRAKFSDYFIAYQGCTVGCLNDGVFPTFKGKTILYANSSVLGNTIFGNNVCAAANATIVNADIPDNNIVIGNSPTISLRKNNKDIYQRPPFHYG